MKLRPRYSILILLIALAAVIILIRLCNGGNRSELRPSLQGESATAQTVQTESAPELSLRDLYKSCNRTIEKARSGTVDLVHVAGAQPVNLTAIRARLEQTSGLVQRVEAIRAQINSRMTPEQQQSSHVCSQRLNQLHQRIADHLNSIDQLAAAPTPDTHRLLQEATLVERTVRAYQLHFQKMCSGIGVRRD